MALFDVPLYFQLAQVPKLGNAKIFGIVLHEVKKPNEFKNVIVDKDY